MESSSIPFRSHTALLLAAALPYLQPSYRHSAELVLKFLELSETLKFYREFPWMDEAISGSTSHNLEKESGILGLIQRLIQDPEGLLTRLTGVCTGKELEIVSMLLNLLRAKSFYDTYGDTLQTFLSSAMPDDFSNSQPFKEAPPSENSQTAGATHDFKHASNDGNAQVYEKTQDSPAAKNLSMSDAAAVLNGSNVAAMLNNEQKETLEFLKNLLESEA